MLAILAALTATALFYVGRSFGYIFQVHRIFPFSAHGLSWSSPECTITTKSVKFTPHFPRPNEPYWGILTVENYEYKDDISHVSLDLLQAKLWFFPVYFRYSGGPWVEVTMDGVAIYIISSRKTPWWVERLRRNIISAILYGETIRLHNVLTKVYLGATTAATGLGSSEVKKLGLNHRETRDQVRAQCNASQWYISTWKGRVYTFGEFKLEMRRNWDEDRGSFVLIFEDSRCIKAPTVGEQRCNTNFRQALYAMYSFPSNLFKIWRDPMSTIDMQVPRCDFTYEDFRLRDAELFHHAATRLKQQYDSYGRSYPGKMEEFAWETFTNMVLTVFQD